MLKVMNIKLKIVVTFVSCFIVYCAFFIIGRNYQMKIYQNLDSNTYQWGHGYVILYKFTNNLNVGKHNSPDISEPIPLDEKIEVFADKRYNDITNEDSLNFYVSNLNNQVWGDDDWLTNQEKEIIKGLAKESGIIGQFKESDFITDYEKIRNFRRSIKEYPDRLFHEEVYGNLGYYNTLKERIEKRNYRNSNSK